MYKNDWIFEVEAFLRKADESFPVPLSQKQDLKLFAEKLCQKATILYCLENAKMVSMLAGYTENLIDNCAYISVVATLDCARGKGYAKKLLKDFINICNEKKISAIHLYAVRSNTSAVQLYKSMGFVEWNLKDESRKDDLHLILRLKR